MIVYQLIVFYSLWLWLIFYRLVNTVVTKGVSLWCKICPGRSMLGHAPCSSEFSENKRDDLAGTYLTPLCWDSHKLWSKGVVEILAAGVINRFCAVAHSPNLDCALLSGMFLEYVPSKFKHLGSCSIHRTFSVSTSCHWWGSDANDQCSILKCIQNQSEPQRAIMVFGPWSPIDSDPDYFSAVSNLMASNLHPPIYTL